MTSDTVRLRYTGTHPKTFTEIGIEVGEDSREFEVPASEVERFTRRADVEIAARGKAKAAPREEASPAAEG